MIGLLTTLVVFALVCYLIFWAMGYLGVAEPIRKVVTVVLVLIVCIWILNNFLPMAGMNAGPRHGLWW